MTRQDIEARLAKAREKRDEMQRDPHSRWSLLKGAERSVTYWVKKLRDFEGEN